MANGKVERVIRLFSIGIPAIGIYVWLFAMVIYIIGRNFGLGWMFVEEYTGYWLVSLGYLPLAYALMTEKHIKMDLVTTHLREKTRRILWVCTESIAVVLVCYLFGRSIGWIIHALKFNLHSLSGLNTLVWPTSLPVCIGLAMFALVLAMRVVHSVAELIHGKNQEPKALEPNVYHKSQH